MRGRCAHRRRIKDIIDTSDFSDANGLKDLQRLAAARGCAGSDQLPTWLSTISCPECSCKVCDVVELRVKDQSIERKVRDGENRESLAKLFVAERPRGTGLFGFMSDVSASQAAP